MVRARRRAAVAVAATLLLAGPLLVAWIWRPETAAGPCVVVSGPTPLPELPESSGLAIGRRTPGLIWSHNDSGNAAVLFGFDAAGSMRARVRVPIVTRDWEDISWAHCASGDCLIIGDIGDNRLARTRIKIYRVPEPAPGDIETAAPDVFNAVYSDGPHNAEALFVVGADLFIIPRDRIGGVYRATMPRSGGGDLTFEPIGQLGLGGVTDAETFADDASVVVRTSNEAVLYRAAELIRGGNRPYFRIPLHGVREPQGEGVAIDGSLLYLSSEGRPWSRPGWLTTLRCELPR